MQGVHYVILLAMLTVGHAVPVGPVEQYDEHYGHPGGEDKEVFELQDITEDQYEENVLFNFWWE